MNCYLCQNELIFPLPEKKWNRNLIYTCPNCHAQYHYYSKDKQPIIVGINKRFGKWNMWFKVKDNCTRFVAIKKTKADQLYGEGSELAVTINSLSTHREQYQYEGFVHPDRFQKLMVFL